MRTAHREHLDRMLIYNPRHLLTVLSESVAHDNEHRPHQGRDQRPPDATPTRPAVVDLDGAWIRRRETLNGLGVSAEERKFEYVSVQRDFFAQI